MGLQVERARAAGLTAVLLGTLGNAREVWEKGSSGMIGRSDHGPCAVILPVSAISMAACG